jgi:signal transduction histidine kinase
MSTMLPPQLSYRARLFVGGLPCLALELLGVAVPLHELQRLPAAAERLGLYAGLVALGVGVVVQTLVLWRWLRPVDEALRLKAAGAPLTAAQADAVYLAILRVPARVVWLRAASWTVGVLGVAVALHYRTGMPTSGLLLFLVVGAVHPLCAEVFRSAWYARVLLDVRADLLPNVDPLRLFADTYCGRLVRGSLAVGLVGAAGVGVFVWLFVWVSLEQYRVLQTYFPFTVAALTTLWYVTLLARRRPLDAYLVAALDKGTDLPRPAAVEEAVPAYRAAQALPYRLALTKLAAWILALLLLCLQGVLIFDIDLETMALISGTAGFAAIGVALSEALAHREVLKPLLAHLAARHRLSIDAVASPVTLRAKMLVAFLGLTVFACGLSFFWSFVEYKRLATAFIKKQSELRLDLIVADIERRAGAPGRGQPREIVEQTLRMVASTDEGARVYFVPAGSLRESLALGPGLKPAPPLPRMVRARFARTQRGTLEVNEHRLTGTFRPVRLGDQELGKVVALYPGYHTRGPGIAGSLRGPLVFFLVLFALSAVVVLRVVRELTMPIHALEERASEMAKGELGRPVYGIGEADELGRLTYAFEEMRRELNRKLRSTESLTIDLEREVARRTEDLERSNRELRDALIQLRRAQAELVRSEKMASIGQLVAGIAHEINNPVNAIANTVSPLEETVQAAVTGSGAAKEAAVTDLGEMLRVIQRGARRTKEIVQALHNYARGDDDRLVEVDLHRGLDDSLDLLRHHLKGLEVERAYGATGRVRGFAGQLHQVFMNLLTNAAQAIRLSGKGGKIRVTTSDRGQSVIIAIADDGPGIPDHLLARIFDPFFTTKDVGEGSGLGLSIVHGIVERHNGSISVASEVGKGTTFTVVLPRGGPTIVPPAPGGSGEAAGTAGG